VRNNKKRASMRLAYIVVLLVVVGFSSCTKEPTLTLNLPANY
jgi:hypothetical protein